MPTDAERETPQAEVIAFLSAPASWPSAPARVDVIETHGALVFLAGDEALKIKRAVRLAYLDFSTLAKREAVCRREIEINRPNAPEIYRDVVAITREAGGTLRIGGAGTPVEWAVRMARFGQEHLLSTIAEREGISDRLAADLAAAVLRAHAEAEVHRLGDAAGHMQAILEGVAGSIAASAGNLDGHEERRRRLLDLGQAALARAETTLRRRADAGLVRRCHGDLHLGNIVLWKGKPQLFDAIEFDESLATIDVLYDLAFLLMDLDRRGQRRAAHIVLDRYLSGSGRDLDLEGLRALPLFLGLRAAIRAMVAFDRAHIGRAAKRAGTERHAVETLDLALGLLSPPAPRLVAIGGLSGTGKTTLAASLAPSLLPSPGALHLRTDVLRKQLAGVGELDRLAPSAYTPEARARVYACLVDRARLALAAGHSVIVDAVFDRPAERDAMAAVAADAGVRFDGVWLVASADILKARVSARTGDASDATPEVVERQLAAPTGDIAWLHLAATGDATAVLAGARGMLGLAAV